MKVLTDFFTGTINPVRLGNYLVKEYHEDDPKLVDWDGEDWDTWSGRVHSWCGLSFNPKDARLVETLFANHGQSLSIYEVAVPEFWW